MPRVSFLSNHMKHHYRPRRHLAKQLMWRRASQSFSFTCSEKKIEKEVAATRFTSIQMCLNQDEGLLQVEQDTRLDETFRSTRDEPVSHIFVESSKNTRKYMEDTSRIVADCDCYADYLDCHTFVSNSLLQQQESTRDPRANRNKMFFVGLFDGHGGNRCSKTLASCLAMNVLRQKESCTDLPEAIRKGFRQQNDAYYKFAKENDLKDGSTAIVAFMREKRLTVANVGDSRALLIRSDLTCLPLSTDHKPSDVVERKRIAARGGFVYHYKGVHRVNGILAVARAFGDVVLHEIVSPEPDIVEHEIGPGDAFVILASDGLWDVMDNHQVMSYVIHNSKFRSRDTLLKNLTAKAIGLGSRDNITIILIDLQEQQRRILKQQTMYQTVLSKAKRLKSKFSGKSTNVV